MGKLILVEFNLDDVDTDELLAELENRYLNHREKELLLALAKDNDPKLKLFMQQAERFSLLELEQMFGEPSTGNAASENQLKLELT